MRHELAVERFYARGVERIGTYHDHYLNFGLWTPAVHDYRAAAEALLARIGTRIGLGPSAEVLDVACGMGTQDVFLAERFGCRRIEAVDLTRRHVELARVRHPHPRVTYRVGDACRLPFPAGRFTHVTAIEGIVHFDTRARFFVEAHRLLRPGGRLGAADYVLARPPGGPFEARLLAWTIRAWHVPAANVAGVAAYRAALETAGFDRVAIELVSDQVIPGYLAEQRRPEIRRAQRRIRGALAGRLGGVINWLVEALYRRGLLGYVLVSARRPEGGPR